MEVIDIKEMEDGSAEITLEMSKEENDMLIGFAVNEILKKSIKELEKEYKNEKN